MTTDSRPRPGPALAAAEAAVRASWARDTCDEADAAAWSPDRPSLGQCGATALVVHDLYGGDLLLAEVWAPDGRLHGYHWWNRLPGGAEVDLTADQFVPGETVQPPRTVPRPDGPPRRCRAQYERLRERVASRLAPAGAAAR